MCQTAPSLGPAIQLAKSAISKEDLICITGSFYLIGEAKTRFQPPSTPA
jgi:folylpolyglutamate synthase/dihydropteroate synthase